MASWETNKIISYFLYKLLLCFSPSTWPIRTNNTAVEPHLTATSLIWSPHYIMTTFFGCPAKMTIHFLVKKSSLIWTPHYYCHSFWPIGDRISRLPLYQPVWITFENWKIFCGFSFQNKQVGASNEREVFKRHNIQEVSIRKTFLIKRTRIISHCFNALNITAQKSTHNY